MGFNYKWNKKHIYYRFLLIVIIIIVFSLDSMFLTNAQENESVNSTINQTNITLPYIDPEIMKAFENSTWVRVLVRLVDTSNITVTGTKEQRMNLSKERDDFLRAKVERFLETLPQNEIRNIRKHPEVFSADITKQGLDRLASDSKVSEILLAFTGPSQGAINISATENQTISKEPVENNVKSIEKKSHLLWLGISVILIGVIVLIIIFFLIKKGQKKNDKKK